jgi:hypothetical protein
LWGCWRNRTYSINSKSHFPAEHADRLLSYGLRGVQFGALEASILSVDSSDQHIRHTRRFKISVDSHQARHRIHRCHENIVALAPFAIPRPCKLGRLVICWKHTVHWAFHCGSACDLPHQPSHKQSQSRLFASQSLANAALFPTLTCSVLISRMQFLIGPKHPYMEQAAEHEPQPTPQSSPRRS